MRSPATLIPTLPEPVRAVLRTGVWAYGTVTSPFRPLPEFLILGAQKAGTTALYEYLRRHPNLTGPSWKEVSFFDRHWVRGAKWYRGNFPNKARTRGKLVGEASPSYHHTLQDTIDKISVHSFQVVGDVALSLIKDS